MIPCAEGVPYPAVAVGDEEALGQGLGIYGLQKIFERHALSVHPAQHHRHLYLPEHTW